MKLTFGKYKGIDLNDIKDTQYLLWAYQNVEWLDAELKVAMVNRIAYLKDVGLEYNKPKRHFVAAKVTTRVFDSQEKRNLIESLSNAELREWEADFINNVLGYSVLTSKQEKVIADICKKHLSV